MEEPTIEYLEEDNEVCNPLSLEDEERYLAQCHPILRDFTVIMIDTGMRNGEVLNLTVEDIDHCKWEIVCAYMSKPNQKQ